MDAQSIEGQIYYLDGEHCLNLLLYIKEIIPKAS